MIKRTKNEEQVDIAIREYRENLIEIFNECFRRIKILREEIFVLKEGVALELSLSVTKQQEQIRQLQERVDAMESKTINAEVVKVGEKTVAIIGKERTVPIYEIRAKEKGWK